MMDSHHHSHLPTIQALAGLATGGQQDTKQNPMGQFQQRQQQQQPLVNTQSQNHQLLHFHHSPAASQTSATASQQHPYSTLSHLNLSQQQPSAHLNMINQLQHLNNGNTGGSGGLFSSSTLHHPTSSQNSASSQATSMTGGGGSSSNQSNQHLQQYFNTTANPHHHHHQLQHNNHLHHHLAHQQLFLNHQTSGAGGGPPSSQSSTGKQQFGGASAANNQQYNMNSSDYSSSTYHVYDQILGDQIIDDLIVIKQERMKKKREQEQKRKVILIGLAAILLVGLLMFLIVKLFDVTSGQQQAAISSNLRFETNTNSNQNDLQQQQQQQPTNPYVPPFVYPGRPHWGAPPGGVHSKQLPNWDFDPTVERMHTPPLASTHRPPPPLSYPTPPVQLDAYRQQQPQPPVIYAPAPQPTSPPVAPQPDEISGDSPQSPSQPMGKPADGQSTIVSGEQETSIKLAAAAPAAAAATPVTATTSDISNNHDNNNLRGCHGRHCPSAGCPNNCSNRGQCVKQSTSGSSVASPASSSSVSASTSGDLLWLQQQQQQEWRCQCAPGSTGDDCSILIERQCDDKLDNDKDGLIDCADSECCSDLVCQNSTLCMKSPDPLEILMRKQPLPPTASFFQRMQFLIDNTQIYTTPSSFNDSILASASKFFDRASVLRGRVTYQKQGVIGVRVSIANQRHAGITLSRDGGHFDLIVNGGGAVTVDFLREPFAALQKTVRVPWNEIVLLDSIELQLDSQLAAAAGQDSPQSTDAAAAAETGPICSAHNYSFLRPQIMAAPSSLRRRPQSSSSAPRTQANKWPRAVILRDSAIVQHSIPLPESSFKPSTSNQQRATKMQDNNNNSKLQVAANSSSTSRDQELVALVYTSSRASEFMSTINIQLTPNQVGDATTKLSDELKSIHLKIIIEGILFEQSFEPQMNLSFTYAWNRRNVYRQKVFGLSTAAVSVGYEYFDCRQVIWSTKHLQLPGHDLAISDIGDAWSLSIHHRYNYREAILHRGDGQNFNLKSERPRVVVPVMGDGKQRPIECPLCDGAAAATLVVSPNEQSLLHPQALVSSPDGALYVGDFNMIRRIEPAAAPQAASSGSSHNGEPPNSSSERLVHTVLEIPPTQALESGYALALNLAGPEAPQLYMTDSERRQVHLVREPTRAGGSDPTTSNETTPPTSGTGATANSAGAAAVWDETLVPVVGSGQRCAPDDPLACGDRGPALQARLIDPKALAFDLAGRMYLADGPNVRLVDLDQQIYTLLGDYSPARKHTKFPCTPGEAIPMHKFVPKWPLDLAINPLDESVHVLDENIVYKITQDKRVQVVAGRPAHCGAGQQQVRVAAGVGGQHQHQQQRASEVYLQSARSIAFNQNGHLFISEDNSATSKHSRVLIVSPEDDTIALYAGTSSAATISGEPAEPEVATVKQHHRMSNTILLGSDLASNQHQHQHHNQHHQTQQPAAQQAADFRFKSVSGLAFDQRGHLLVADKLTRRVVSVEPDLPQLTYADEYEIPSPENPSELLVFNKHGHQIYTRDLVPAGAGHAPGVKRAVLPNRYTFTYTMNTPFGQLASVRYASMNKITTYSRHGVKMIETDFGGQCTLDVARNGQVHSISISSASQTGVSGGGGGGESPTMGARNLGTKITMSYHVGGSLLKQSRDQASGETYEFTYDEFGRALAIQHSSPRIPQAVDCRLQQQVAASSLGQNQVCTSLIVAE